jgi:hypothetical protein
MVLFSISPAASGFALTIDEGRVSDMPSIESSASDAAEKIEANAPQSSVHVDSSSVSAHNLRW